MSEYKLRALRLVRRREEESALAQLGAAIRARTAAEAQEQRWQEQVRLGRKDLAAATRAARSNAKGAATAPTRTAGAVLDEARFVARRQGALNRAEAALAAFRQDVLAKARAAEEAARAQHLAARAAREALDRHEAHMHATLRRVAERRAELDLDDLPLPETSSSKRR
jgi:hypothetical protein